MIINFYNYVIRMKRGSVVSKLKAACVSAPGIKELIKDETFCAYPKPNEPEARASWKVARQPYASLYVFPILYYYCFVLIVNL